MHPSSMVVNQGFQKQMHVHVSLSQTYDEFKKDVTFAFLNTRGYGYA